MTRVDVGIKEDVVTLLNKLQNINDVGIDLYIPVGSALFGNILNLKLLKKELEDSGKVLHFVTEDETGNALIGMLDSDTSTSFIPEDFGDMSSKTVTLGEGIPDLLSRVKPRFKFPKFSVKYPILVLVVFGLGVLGLYKLSGKSQAVIEINVKSQAFTRSVSIKVKKDAISDVEQGVLSGETVSKTLVENVDSATTGEKLVGEKATGKVTIFNKTSKDVDLDEGTELTFDDGDEDLIFVLTEDITIPAIYEKDPTDPSTVLIPGQEEAKIEAFDIGSKFNIDADETLGVEDYKKSELVAEVVDDLEGGTSETVKIVALGDQETLASTALKNITTRADASLRTGLSEGKKYIDGSSNVTVQKSTYDYKVGDEAEKLSLVMDASAMGLTYNEDDLTDLLDKLVIKSMPEEYVITDEGREVKVEVLGTTDSSILSPSEADLQVTSKTFVVPNISEDDLRERLKGKSVDEAEKILGSLKDIDSYEVKIRGGLPFLRKIPKDTGRISLEITKSDE